MKYNTIKYFSTVNGEGTRTAIFVSGCRNHCKGCFNQIAWDFDYGKELTDDIIDKILESIEPIYIHGISILGGEPLDERNQEGVWHIIEKFRNKFGDTKDIWMWSGFYYENIPETEYKEKILSEVNTLVDGPFVSGLYNINLVFKGSSNQHILKLKK